MKSQNPAVYGTFTSAMRNHINVNGGVNRTATQAELIDVYKTQIAENIKNVEGYTGQDCAEAIPFSVSAFVRRHKGVRIGYMQNENNRSTCIWKFPAFARKD